MSEKIVAYKLAYVSDKNVGAVALRLESGQEITIKGEAGPAELAALAAVLNKTPVFYNEQGNSIGTSWVVSG